MRSMSNWSIGQKLYAATGFIAIVLALVTALSIIQVSREINHRINDDLADVTQMGVTTLNHFAQKAARGELSEDQAQQQALDVISDMRFDGDNYIFILDQDLVMVMHAVKPELNGVNVTTRQDPNGVYLFQDMARAVRNGGEGLVPYEWPRAGENNPVPKRSHVRLHSEWGYIVGAGAYIDDVNSGVWASLNGLVLGVVFLILSMIGGSIWLNRMIQVPVNRLCDSVKSLADGDYSSPLPEPEGCEVRRLTDAIEILRQNEQKREGYQEEVQAAQAAQVERAERIEAASKAFQTQCDKVLSVFDQACEGLNNASDMLRNTVRDTSANSDSLDRASNSAAESAEIVAAAAEELTASIGDIAQQVTRSSDVGKTAVDRANRAGDDINRLVEAAGKIDGVVRLINDIAEQTNLLALNATIEAARAGEAGKGFAVVASEVKALASQTANATGSIANEVKGIQDATDKAVDAIKMIREVIDEMSGISESISSSMEQQRKAADEIAGSAQRASGAAQDVSGAVDGVKSTASNTTSSAEHVTQADQSIRQQVGALKEAIGRFMNDVRAA